MFDNRYVIEKSNLNLILSEKGKLIYYFEKDKMICKTHHVSYVSLSCYEKFLCFQLLFVLKLLSLTVGNVNLPNAPNAIKKLT